MYFWSVLKGSFTATKLSNNISTIWVNSVNSIVSANIEIKIEDSAMILKESYALCLCVYGIYHPKDNVDKRGAIIITTLGNLKGFLMENWKPLIKEEELSEIVENVIDSFEDYGNIWINDLIECNKSNFEKNVDLRIITLMNIGIDKYLTFIKSITSKDIGNDDSLSYDFVSKIKLDIKEQLLKISK